MLVRYGRTIATLAVLVVLMQVSMASAGGLGIPLDGFLTTLLTFVTGLGLLMFTIGAGSWASMGAVG